VIQKTSKVRTTKREEEGREKEMTFISQRHTARFKKLKISSKLPNKKECQLKRDKGYEIKYLRNNPGLERRRK